MTHLPAILQLTPPAAPIDAEIRLPGSKSITNRALIMAALGTGKVLLRNPSVSDDSTVLIENLRRLGIEFDWSGDDLVVQGNGASFIPFHGTINVGPAGTAMRFLTALCCLMPQSEVVLCGTERMHERPIGPLVDALRALGADIEYRGKPGCPPLLIRGEKSISGGCVRMTGEVSSQYFTALLLIAPRLAGGLEIEVDGEQSSRSYIDMTIAGLRDFGVQVRNDGYRRYRVEAGQQYRPPEKLIIEGDASGASYFWAAAALSGGRVRVHNISPSSPQGDAAFPHALEQMGCGIATGRDAASEWIEVRGGGALHGISIDMSSMPDTAQTLAVVACASEGASLLSGLHSLRMKETDRIAAVCSELSRLGIAAHGTGDSISIDGGIPHPGIVKTYDDHRMAMAFAVLGARYPGIAIENPEVVTKSFPAFWKQFAQLGIRLD